MKTKPRNRSIRRVGFALLVGIAVLMTGPGADAKPERHRLGDIPLSQEAYQKYLKKAPQEMLTMEALLPAAYDARDDAIVTRAKNQGACGSCWAFACVGALESHLIKADITGPEDLSEQQQVSCNTAMWGCDGGNATALRYWEGKGPIDEIDYPYDGYESTCIEDQLLQLGYRVSDFHTVPTDTYAFKESLYTYGPSYWRYSVYSDFDTYWSTGGPGEVYVSQLGASYRGGHAVLLIGWDDTKNAFLCKNSWGEYGGPNGDGTFWIAYDGHANNLGFGMANFSVTSIACSTDADCDDGVFCNGREICVDNVCQPGETVTCPDDGLYCNGEEFCDDSNSTCGHTGNPCADGYKCDELYDLCSTGFCGDGTCDDGEDCLNCEPDCISGTGGGGDCADCFKGDCDGVCHPVKEGPACPDCAPAFCCGDGVCSPGETGVNCAVDCGEPATVESDCLDEMDNDGDGDIDCADSDCGTEAYCTGSPETLCSDGIDNDGDGYKDCSDPDCEFDDSCLLPPCGEKKAPCTLDAECCSGKCAGGKCR